MDIDEIRERISRKPLRITAHGSVEATKDGLSPQEMRFVIQNGKIIEEYVSSSNLMVSKKVVFNNIRFCYTG